MVVGQLAQETDLVVIGGSAGGLAAALRAAELGVRTVLVRPAPDHDGVTLAVIRRAADALRRLERGDLGASAAAPKPDLPGLRASAREIAAEARARQEHMCAERGVDVVEGKACFDDARQVTVRDGTNARIRFRRAIIATGCLALPPTGGWPQSLRVTHWHGAMQLDRVPKTLLVLGGGPFAVELAGDFAALGSKVSLVTPRERLLSEADPDLVMPLRERLAERLEAICTSAEAVKFRDLPDGIEVDFREEGNTWRRGYDHVIVALGARPDTGALDVAKANVELDDAGAIKVDDRQRTTNPRILAAGDVTGPPYQDSRAEAQGRVAAEIAAGRDSVFDARAVPTVVHADPQVAWCGLTATAATAAGIPHETADTPRCHVVAMARLVLDPETALVLGAGLVGDGAADAVGEAALAIEMGAVAEDLASTIHSPSSISRLLAEAAGHAGGPLEDKSRN